MNAAKSPVIARACAAAGRVWCDVVERRLRAGDDPRELALGLLITAALVAGLDGVSSRGFAMLASITFRAYSTMPATELDEIMKGGTRA